MNIFDILNRGDSRLYEPSMSAMLGYLLDSSEDHGLGSTFVKAFLHQVNSERFKAILENPFIDYRVSLEEDYELNGKTKYIDIQINIFNKKENGKELHRVIIENKVRKGAANETQLRDYYDAVLMNSDIEEENITFIFLTPKCNSDKLKNEYENLNLDEPQKSWIYWESDESDKKSITYILEQILLAESTGQINPINEYVRHTLKAFRKYCLTTFAPPSKRQMLQGDIGDEIESVEIELNNKFFTVIKRNSGQIQVINSDNEKIPAKPILIEYITKNLGIDKSYLENNNGNLCNTREVGKRFFNWMRERKA